MGRAALIPLSGVTMHRDRQQVAGVKAGRQLTSRKEWSPRQEQQRQMEARDHARQHGKTHRRIEVRPVEAERELRELWAHC